MFNAKSYHCSKTENLVSVGTSIDQLPPANDFASSR